MTTRPARSRRSAATAASDQGNIEADLSELTKLTISMPKWMLEELRSRARQRGVTVTELIRRAVALEKMLFEDPEQEVLLRHKETGKEVAIRVL